MTTLTSIALTCPICNNQFGSKAVLQRDAAGRKHTDFQEPAAGRTTLPYLIHLCPRCGYSATAEEFEEHEPADTTLQSHVWNELTPRLTSLEPVGSEKYEFAAKVAVWQGDDPRRIGDLWLYAAWCCVDEDDVEAERYFRRFAARAFEEALSTYDGVERDDRAVLTYLVGELWRRVGDEKLAHAWFDRVPSEVTRPSAQKWIIDAAKLQRDDPREWFR